MEKEKTNENKRNIGKTIAVNGLVIVTIMSILFCLITFLYFPNLSYSLFGDYASYSGITHHDSVLEKDDLLVTKRENFDDLLGKVIVINLIGYGDDTDGIKTYRAASYVVDETEGNYYLVHSTEDSYFFPWKITEEMYLGTVHYEVPGIGAIISFLIAKESALFYIAAFISITGIVLVLKYDKGKKKTKKVYTTNVSKKVKSADDK
jgi:hypothetical protein